MSAKLEGKIATPGAVPMRRTVLKAAASLGALGRLGAILTDPLEARAAPAGLTLPPASEALTPFQASFPRDAPRDLKRRLSMTRWPERETVGDWSQGVPLEKAQALIAYWRDKYDLRRFEARINAFLQYRTRIDGLGIHFFHVRSPHPNALPIILTHGWPGSFVEFMEIMRPLSDPTRYGGRAEDPFPVVAPSLPGFAVSDKPTETSWGVEPSAPASATLRQSLRPHRWVGHGCRSGGGGIDLPMAASVFPPEIFSPPRAWAEALWPNLFYWNELDKGGHFAAFEQPALFTEELRKAFRSRRA